MSRSERKCVDVKGKVNSPMYYRAVNVKQSSGQGHWCLFKDQGDICQIVILFTVQNCIIYQYNALFVVTTTVWGYYGEKIIIIKATSGLQLLQKTAVECTFLPVPDYFTNK